MECSSWFKCDNCSSIKASSTGSNTKLKQTNSSPLKLFWWQCFIHMSLKYNNKQLWFGFIFWYKKFNSSMCLYIVHASIPTGTWVTLKTFLLIIKFSLYYNITNDIFIIKRNIFNIMQAPVFIPYICMYHIEGMQAHVQVTHS